MTPHPLIKRYYPESNLLSHTFVDGTLTFYVSVNSLLHVDAQNKTILDLGCGRGAFVEGGDPYIIHLQNFKGRVKRVIGIDVDLDAVNNPFIDEFHLLEIDKPWPVEDNSIDLCICDWVMEHVINIDFFFSELNRVIKQGGFICIRTTNRYGYIAAVSAIIPNKWHKKVLKTIQPQRKEEDVFPTVYNCNSRRLLDAALRKNGFEPHVYYHNSEPNYFKFSSIAFAFGYFLQKILPITMRSTILSFGKKK